RPARRPCRRRQLPLELRARPERPPRGGGGERAQRPPGGSCTTARRHLHRRARNRAGQAEIPARRAWRRRGGGDAGGENGVGASECDEYWQDLRGLAALYWRRFGGLHAL